jgi:hypothetical protein
MAKPSRIPLRKGYPSWISAGKIQRMATVAIVALLFGTFCVTCAASVFIPDGRKMILSGRPSDEFDSSTLGTQFYPTLDNIGNGSSVEKVNHLTGLRGAFITRRLQERRKDTSEEDSKMRQRGFIAAIAVMALLVLWAKFARNNEQRIHAARTRVTFDLYKQ